MHVMRESFVGAVKDARRATGKKIKEGELGSIVEFPTQARGHEASEKANLNRVQRYQTLSDWQLADRLAKDRPILLIPASSVVK